MGVIVLWGMKIHRIQSLMKEVKMTEREIASGQDLWRRFPPLEPKERQALKASQERLLQMLPDNKDIPALLEQVSHLTREYNLSDVSLHTDEFQSGKPGAAVSATAAAQNTKTTEDSSAVSSFPVKLSFAGDYRETAYFLDALQNLPRLVRVESVKMQRGVPLVVSEVVWKSYFKNEDLRVMGQ
ncbi:MAG: type 4a pilus biogenesis protein PilO [Deltaproteobacteria bacterium]|nr:type 4a pilus biogenesis protein PilO [Deltaproteobacteria bacterium]